MLNLSDLLLVLVLTWTRPSSSLRLDSGSTCSGLGLDSGWNELVSTVALVHSHPPEWSLSWRSSFFGANVSSIITHASAPVSNWKCCLTYFQPCNPCFLVNRIQYLVLWFLWFSMLWDVLLQGIWLLAHELLFPGCALFPPPSRGSSAGALQDELTWHFTSLQTSMHCLFPPNVPRLMSSTYLKVVWLLFWPLNGRECE